MLDWLGMIKAFSLLVMLVAWFKFISEELKSPDLPKNHEEQEEMLKDYKDIGKLV